MWSSPTVKDGVVYFGSDDHFLYAVDVATHQLKWKFDWRGRVFALEAQTGQEKWNFDTGDAVVPSPTVVDGVVYVSSKYPCVYALDAQSGQKRWCFSYPSDIAWVESSAAVANGTVYVGSSDWMRLNALDAVTGQLKWHFSTKGDPWCSPAGAEGVVYIGATGGYFYAVDAETGRELWRVKTGPALKTTDVRFDGGVVSSPTVVEKVVYFGSLDGNLYAVSTTRKLK